MTLYLDITKVEGLKQSKGFLIVEGSRAGLLISEEIQSSSHSFHSKFKVICSKDDNLIFKFCKSKEAFMGGEAYAEGYFHAPIFVTKHDKNLDRDQEYKYTIEMLNDKGEDAGEIKADITYDSVSHFEGEFCVGEKVKKPERRKMYKGKCPTKNLFSYFDPAAKDQQNKWVESIYKDDE